ncbi:MAG: hypothetical protein IT436_08225 [Phycisphaerales bacterium]|nr:hypothetical protein [Phycisphaerales bacterium]
MKTPRKRVLIVTGAHLDAEMQDRPLAYKLREAVRRALVERGEKHFEVVVCSDLWYLNNEELRREPTVSIGGPTRNALGAHLADKVPSALVIEGKLAVQMDVELSELVASCWGVDSGATAGAVDAFIERYLEEFVGRVVEK